MSTRGADVVTETNSNVHHRLNSFKLRAILKVNDSTKLCNVNFKCSNLVNSLSINNVCKPLLKQNTVMLKTDSNSLTSYKLSNIRNTIRTNLVTIHNDYSSSARKNTKISAK